MEETGAEHQFKLPGRAEQPPPRRQLDGMEPPPGTQWLTRWSGKKHQTTKAVLNAACQYCGSAYQLSGSVLNARAAQTGAMGKFSRWIDRADLWANSGNPNSRRAGAQLKYNRDKAAVDANEAAMHQAVRACLCPECGSDQVLVESPA